MSDINIVKRLITHKCGHQELHVLPKDTKKQKAMYCKMQHTICSDCFEIDKADNSRKIELQKEKAKNTYIPKNQHITTAEKPTGRYCCQNGHGEQNFSNGMVGVVYVGEHGYDWHQGHMGFIDDPDWTPVMAVVVENGWVKAWTNLCGKEDKQFGPVSDSAIMFAISYVKGIAAEYGKNLKREILPLTYEKPGAKKVKRENAEIKQLSLFDYLQA